MAEWYCSSTRPPPAFPASPIAMAQSPGQSAHSDIVFMTEAEDGAERGAAAKSAYLPVGFGPPPEAPRGLRLDFNLGCRVLVPSGNWHPRPRELKTSNTLGETTIGSSTLSSSERTFIRLATRRVHRRTVPRRMGIAARAAGRDPADCRTLSAHLGAELLRAKYSTNRNGWRETVAPLRANGCRVVCIDQKPAHGQSVVWTEIPCCAEAQTGDRRLVETLGWLRHAVAFVDLPNGPRWLARAAGWPVELVGSFPHPSNEFVTPYRIVNHDAGNSCRNEPRALVRLQALCAVSGTRGHTAAVPTRAVDNHSPGWRRSSVACRDSRPPLPPPT